MKVQLLINETSVQRMRTVEKVVSKQLKGDE